MKYPAHVRQDSDERGRHLRASRFIAKHELVFCERPLLCLQSVGNAHGGALACRHCRAFVGGPDLCIALASGRVDRADAYEYWKKNDLHRTDDDYQLVPCRQGCGEVYCSSECEEDHWNCGGHELLCTGLIPEPENEDELHPLIQFKIHAVQNNEIFLMVADMICSILSQRIRQLEQQTGESKDALLSPYLDFTLVPWWDVATAPLLASPTGLEQAAELKQALKQLCLESSSLLKLALAQHQSARQALNEFPDLCTMDFFAKIIGSFEQNAIGIRRRHALCRSVFDAEFRHRNKSDLIKCLENVGLIGDEGEENHKGSGDAAHNKVEKEQDNAEWDYSDDELAVFLAGLDMNEGSHAESRQITDDEEKADEPEVPGDDLDALFTPLDGTAMYSTACKMNHSCNPNIVMLYKGNGWGRNYPLAAYAVALQDIQPGEELCISYIQSDAPLEERKAALANYGFECTCDRCVEEEEATTLVTRADDVNPNEFDEDDLFGDDDDADDEPESDNGSEPIANATGESSLQERLATLDTMSNAATDGTIPLKALAQVSGFVIQIGGSVSELLRQEDDSKLLGNMKLAVDAVQTRSFSSCKTMGSLLEKELFQLLEDTGRWPHIAYREAHGCCAVIAAIGYAHAGCFIRAQYMLDKATILGLPRERVGEFFDYVEYHAVHVACNPHIPPMLFTIPDYQKAPLVSLLTDKALSRPITSPIQELQQTIEEEKFNQEYVSKSQPVVFRGFASEWPAVSKWRRMQSLVHTHGHRLVPIEVGSMMKGGDGMQEKLTTLREFVDLYLAPSCRHSPWTLEYSHSPGVAYLAQHPLLQQIPQLREDVESSPRLCGELGPTHVNMWIGTGGTRTPLHYDSYDNLFVQIAGGKYVRIYEADESKNLYIIRDGDKTSKYAQGNMSAVNCEMEDYDGAHPLARNAKYVEVLMLPGDCLFIPAKAWHYVRSLSTSISVNYWF